MNVILDFRNMFISYRQVKLHSYKISRSYFHLYYNFKLSQNKILNMFINKVDLKDKTIKLHVKLLCKLRHAF